MAHFAQIDNDNIVIQVIVAEQDFINSGTVGDPSKWIQTSYNTRLGQHWTENEDGTVFLSADQTRALRKNFAGVGYTYDSERDAFIPPKPTDYDTVFNETTCIWDRI